jgi:hypothetical protein
MSRKDLPEVDGMEAHIVALALRAYRNKARKSRATLVRKFGEDAQTSRLDMIIGTCHRLAPQFENLARTAGYTPPDQ